MAYFYIHYHALAVMCCRIVAPTCRNSGTIPLASRELISQEIELYSVPCVTCPGTTDNSIYQPTVREQQAKNSATYSPLIIVPLFLLPAGNVPQPLLSLLVSPQCKRIPVSTNNCIVIVNPSTLYNPSVVFRNMQCALYFYHCSVTCWHVSCSMDFVTVCLALTLSHITDTYSKIVNFNHFLSHTCSRKAAEIYTQHFIRI